MIELRHLKYFIAVAEELNFRRASERVFVDQSAVSRAVRELEGEVGAVFSRTTRALRLTPAGAMLLEHARDVLIRVERAKRRAQEAGDAHRVPLRVGVADGLSQPRLVRCLVGWRDGMPEAPLELTDLRASELIDALRREELDVGFSFGGPPSETIEQEGVWSYPLVTVCPSEHALVRQARLSLDDVIVHPVVSWHSRDIPGKRRQIDQLIGRCGAPVVMAGEVGSLAGLINMVGTGLGVGLTDGGHTETLRRSDIAAIEIRDAGAFVSTYVLHKRHVAPPRQVVQCFIAHAKTFR